MIKIAVCDDDIQELKKILNILSEYQSINKISFKIDFYSSGDELISALEYNNYQILILDILMPGINGIETAKEIRSFDSEVDIVFLTSSPEFAIDGYSVKAFNYLIKPASSETLFPIINELVHKTAKSEDMLILNSPLETVKIPFSHIEFLEIFNKKILLNLDDGSVKGISGTLADFEKKLTNRKEFIKVHRSYIVNMDCILSLKKSEIITYNNKKVPVSRLLYNDIKQKYVEYLFGDGGKSLW